MVISQAALGATPTEQAEDTQMWSFFQEVHIREITKTGDGMALLTGDVGLAQPVAVNLLDYIQQSAEDQNTPSCEPPPLS